MNTRVRITALLLTTCAVFAACASTSTEVGAGREVADPTTLRSNFEFVTFAGDEVELQDFAEGPVVVNFFASWCPSCVAELPDFQRVSEDLRGEVQFLGLAFRDPEELALDLVETTGVTFPTALDPYGDVYLNFGGLTMPTTVFIDADGVVRNVHSGVLSEDQLRQEIEEHFSR